MIPRWFQTALAWWKPKARALGAFQTKAVLTLFYAFLFAPTALLARAAGRFRPPPPGWRPRETRDRALADLRRQS